MRDQGIVNARNLEVTFQRPGHLPVTALRNLNLTVDNGEFIAVIGSSGAGKTTLLRCLTGFVRPSSGGLTVDGIDAARARGNELRRLRTRVATIYQHFNLVERATAMQNVLHGRLGHVGFLRGLTGLFSHEDKLLAWRALTELGLSGQALQRVDQLSGGERQRVAIARALMQEPRIVLADEPAASLDVALTRQVIEILHQLHAESGITVIVNMHDIELARSCASRIVGIRRGVVVFDGAPSLLTDETLEVIYGGEQSGWRQPTTDTEPATPERLLPAEATA